MRTIAWFGMAGCGHWIRLELISPTGLLTLVGEGSLLVSLVLGFCALLPAGNGTVLFLTFTASTCKCTCGCDEDGHNGSAPHPTVWDRGAKTKKRRVLQAVSEFAWVPGSIGGMVRLAGLVSTLMLLTLLLGLSLLVCSLSCVLFLVSLHLPAVVDDLGPAGVSYVEMLILHERSAGERLVLEPAVSRSRRGGRPSSVSAVPVRPSIDIWRSCRFFGSMLRA